MASESVVDSKALNFSATHSKRAHLAGCCQDPSTSSTFVAQWPQRHRFTGCSVVRTTTATLARTAPFAAARDSGTPLARDRLEMLDEQ
jgi:hypothetical protein